MSVRAENVDSQIETGWLIELPSGKHPWPGVASPTWWNGGLLGFLNFNSDSLCAVRFCRQGDAERVLRVLIARNERIFKDCIIAEHVWSCNREL